MSLESEFVGLCYDFFDKPSTKGQNPARISQFFARIMKDGKQVEITNEVRYYIPLLAAYNDGIFCTLLETGISGISPIHYVPDLQLAKPVEPDAPKSQRSARNPRRTTKKVPQSARSPQIEDLEVQELTLPHTPRTTRNLTTRQTKILPHREPLPPLTQTQDAVIPTLYASVVKNNFFMAKKTEKDSRDVKILPPNYPMHLVGKEFSMMSVSGVVMTNGEHSEVLDLSTFVKDRAYEFIAEKQLLQVRYYRRFYTWRLKFRDLRFRRIITGFDKTQAVAFPGFVKLVDEIRDRVLTITEPFVVYESEFDARMEEVSFETLKEVASNSVQDMNDKMTALCEETGQKITKFFKHVRAANLLMQLDFEELHSLNALPVSLQQFASDLKWKVPSIWRQRLRETKLNEERKLASLRQEYLSTYFTKVKSMYTGLVVLQCDRVIRRFMERFSQRCSFKKRINRIESSFDLKEGVKTSPSRDEFVRWVKCTVAEIKQAFLGSNKLISLDVITEIDPEYEFNEEDPYVVLDRFIPLKRMVNDAFTSIDQCFSYFDLELHPYSTVMKVLVDKVQEAALFTDLRNVEKLEETIKELVKQQEDLQKRPKNLFHRSTFDDTVTNFVIDMKPTLEAAGKHLEQGMEEFKARVANELNNSLFSEIQEKWVTVKDQKIPKSAVRYLEMRMVLFAVMAEVLRSAWGVIPFVKASFETIIGIYRSLNKKSKYTHVEAIMSFNKAAENYGIPVIDMETKSHEEEDVEYEEEEEEEDASEEIVTKSDLFPPRRPRM